MSFFNCIDFTTPNWSYPLSCLPTMRADKLCRLVFLKCDALPLDLCDDVQIQQYLESCQLRSSPLIKGQLEESSSKRNGMRCEGARVNKSIKSITFEDSNHQLSNDNYRFWNLMEMKQRDWRLGWLTEDQLFGFYKFTIHMSENISSTPTQYRRKKGEIEINILSMPTPIASYSPNLITFLNQYSAWNCVTSTFVTDAIIECGPPSVLLFYNVEVTLDCPFGTVGPSVTIPAGTFTSNISQLNADNLAIDAAQAALICDPPTNFTFCTNDPPNNVYYSALGLDSMPYPSQVSQGNHVSQLVPLTLPTLYRAGTNGFFGNTQIFVNGILVATSVNGAYSGSFLVSPGDIVSVGNSSC